MPRYWGVSVKAMSATRRKEFVFVNGVVGRGGRTHLIIVEAADGTSKISTAEWRGNLPVGLGQTDRITDTSFDELVKNARRSGGIER
jgi:hypothetical protein